MSKHKLPEEGHFSFPELDTQLNIIWHSIIEQALRQYRPNTQVDDFNVDWIALCKSLINGIFSVSQVGWPSVGIMLYDGVLFVGQLVAVNGCLTICSAFSFERCHCHKPSSNPSVCARH